MGIRRFLTFLRQKTNANAPLLTTLANEQFQNSTISIDANNYFYKFLNTEEDCFTEIEQIFCAITCNVHDTTALSIINDHLMQCSTSSERHLLRCLYIFCTFCYTSLQIRHIVFVLDGAAPMAKSLELVERKQQKRFAHGRMLNERRALLLHRIYVLRWYQTLCITLALLDHNSIDTTAAVDSPPHLALYRVMQNVFEWSMGTELPETLFNNCARSTILSSVAVNDTNVLLQTFERVRMNVQTSFVVEIDLVNADVQLLATILKLLLNAMIQTDSAAAAYGPAATSNTFRPFLVCIHANKQHKQYIEQQLTSGEHESIEKCWQNCRATFLVCCIAHCDTGNNRQYMLPKSFYSSRTGTAPATAAFARWENITKQFWCCKDIFVHQNQHVWRSIEYAEWLSSEKSSMWLRLVGQTKTNETTAAAVTEQQKLAHFYCKNSPLSFCDVYDTRNDESHYNLCWNEQTCALFAQQSTHKVTANLTLFDFSNDFFGKKRRVGTKRALVDDSMNSDDNSAKSEPDFPSAHDFHTEHHNTLTSDVDKRHRRHIRYRMRDEYLQIVVRFLRVVCGVQVIVAEHEAEATCAKLCRDQFVNFVFSDDIDALAFGSPNIVIDWPSIHDIGKSLLLMSGTLPPTFFAKIISSATILNQFDININQFTLWCVFCGTDFFQIDIGGSTTVCSLLHMIKTSDSVAVCLQKIASEHSDNLCQMINDACEFFKKNQTAEKTDFLQRQFAPHSVDETKNLHVICANRKTGFAASGVE